jgi:hypothetical protein
VFYAGANKGTFTGVHDADEAPPKGTKVEILERGGAWVIRKKDGPGAYISRHSTNSEAQAEAHRNRWGITRSDDADGTAYHKDGGSDLRCDELCAAVHALDARLDAFFPEQPAQLMTRKDYAPDDLHTLAAALRGVSVPNLEASPREIGDASFSELEAMSNAELVARRQQCLAGDPGSKMAKEAEEIRRLLDKRKSGRVDGVRADDEQTLIDIARRRDIKIPVSR